MAKEKFYAANKPGNVNFYNIDISKFVKTRTKSKYCIVYLDKVLSSKF